MKGVIFSVLRKAKNFKQVKGDATSHRRTVKQTGNPFLLRGLRLET